MRFMKWG